MVQVVQKADSSQGGEEVILRHLPERGRENSSFPVEEGMGKPWVSQEQ